jgi:hypothetical protein
MQWRGVMRQVVMTVCARMVIGQDMQRDSPRATIVDVGGLELSVRARLV